MPLRRPVARIPLVPPRWVLLCAALVGAALLAASCSDKTTAPPPVTTGPSLTLVPPAARVEIRDSVHLVATARNLASPAVTWTLTRMSPTPDTVGLGTLVATGPTTATYTAPDSVVSSLDYRVKVTATSAVNDTVRAEAILTIPRIIVSVVPTYLGSVPPGTLVPFAVSVDNTPNHAYHLFVQGIPGGDESVGTWTQTGPQATIYQAPSVQLSTSTLDLLVRSDDDPARFATAEVTVRSGFPLPVARPDLGQYAPEWSPDGLALAYVQGPPWEVAVYDFLTASERTLTTLAWSGDTYDGRLSWSDDGTRIAFSEESGGRRAIGVVETGGARSSFGPDPTMNYYEGVFVPKVAPDAPESLVVSQAFAGVPALRLYPLAAAQSDPGRPFAGAGAARWPDIVRIPETSGRRVLHVAATDPDLGQVFTLGDGEGARTILPSSDGQTQVHWGQQISGPLWITFIASADRTAYRGARQGFPDPVRLYSEFLPELGMDLTFGQGYDAHALSRLMPDGSARIWVVQFPPSAYGGPSQREIRELASLGIHGALTPSSWSRWLGALQPRLAPLPWSQAVQGAREVLGRSAVRPSAR